MGGSLFFKTEVLDSSLLGHIPKEFSFRLTWCPWLVGYYDTQGLVSMVSRILWHPRINRGTRKLALTLSLSKKKKTVGAIS